MYNDQVLNNWTGSAKEAEELCEELIEKVNETEMKKKLCYKIMKEACLQKEDEPKPKKLPK